MSQPFNRVCRIEPLGEVHEEAGEFWAENPFEMPLARQNLSAYERNCLYLNLGELQFLDASFASAADIDSDSRAALVADFNGDRAPDLLVVSVGGGVLRLFLNRMEQGNRLAVTLKGEQSNRRGIGAQVTARIGNRSLVRDVFAVNGSMGQSPPFIDIGLGEAEKIDELTVRWPSGRVSRAADVPAGHIVIQEGTTSDLETNPPPVRSD